MLRKLQFVAAIVIMVVVITSAPALLCVTYLGQSSTAHDCCPSPAAPAKSVPVCCVQSPAITTQAVDVDHSATLAAIAPVANEHNVTVLVNFIPSVLSAAEPPSSNPVLRI